MADEVRLTDAEWTLMHAVWGRGKATVRELHADVEGESGWAYSTVKTMLERLAAKGLLVESRVGPVKQYAARRPRQTTVTREVGRFLDRVLDDSMSPLVHYIAKARGLSDQDVAALRRILEEEVSGDGPTGPEGGGAGRGRGRRGGRPS